MMASMTTTRLLTSADGWTQGCRLCRTIGMEANIDTDVDLFDQADEAKKAAMGEPKAESKEEEKSTKKPTFSLSKVRARIRPSKLVRSTTEASGAKGKIAKVTEVEMTLEVGNLDDEGDVDPSFYEAVEVLWPGMRKMIKTIGANEEHQGLDVTSRGKLSDSTVDVFNIDPRTDAFKEDEPLFHLTGARIKGKPKLKVGEDGDAVLVLKVLSKFKKADLAKLTQHIESDVWVSMIPTQVEMSEVIEDEDGAGKVVATIGTAS